MLVSLGYCYCCYFCWNFNEIRNTSWKYGNHRCYSNYFVSLPFLILLHPQTFSMKNAMCAQHDNSLPYPSVEEMYEKFRNGLFFSFSFFSTRTNPIVVSSCPKWLFLVNRLHCIDVHANFRYRSFQFNHVCSLFCTSITQFFPSRLPRFAPSFFGPDCVCEYQLRWSNWQVVDQIIAMLVSSLVTFDAVPSES